MGGDGGGVAAEATESDTAPCGGGGGTTVHIRCPNDLKFSVKISLDSTVGSFKSVLAQSGDIPADQQRLIYKGQVLKDDQTLESYGLEADHTVHLVRGFAPATSANTTGASNTGDPNSTPSGVRSALGGSGLGASLFSGIGAILFGAGLPVLEQVQQQLTQNPNMIREMLDMPFVQNLLNNPEMTNLITNSPQMREVFDRNPQIAHILSDPSTLRQMLEAATNPELIGEMIRNTDRAVRNIESSPEGFDMPRRMYENIQEPFLNATTMAGDAINDLGSNPFAALLGRQGGGPGTGQSTNPTIDGSETTSNLPCPNTNPLPNPWAPGEAGDAQMISNTRLNPAGDVRLPALGRLGGLAFSEYQPMIDFTQDTASLIQFMQNPFVSQITQSLISNPQAIDQILCLDPLLWNMLDSNPQLRQMMLNPEFLRQLTSPGTLEQLLNLLQALQSLLDREPSSTREAGRTGGETGQTGGEAGTLENAVVDMLMNMISGIGIGNPTIPNGSNVPPEELYATQLSQLQEMGFVDTRENIQALITTGGNVPAALERLIGNLDQ